MDTIYYVDGGTVIQQDTYPDGTQNWTDTGISSNLPTGTASGDPNSLAGDGAGAASGGGGDQGGGQSWQPQPDQGGGGAQAPSVVEDIFYVDSGSIIEKVTYSDGNVTYTDTGQSSNLGNGAAANDVGSLVAAPNNVQYDNGSSAGSSDPYNTQQAPNDSSGGFQQLNSNAGGYGPYATPDPPQLTDQGTYPDNGRLIHQQVDQYGNSYYTDVGPAQGGQQQPQQRAPVQQRQAPSVPSNRAPRQVGPSLYGGQQQQQARPAATSTYSANAPANEAHASDGQTLSQQDAGTRAMFGAVYGANAAGQWAQQHSAALGGTAPAAASTTRAPVVQGTRQGSAPAQATTGARATGGPTATGTGTHPTGAHGASTAAVSVGGNPTAFGHQVIGWLSRSDFIGGLPNGLLVAGGALGYQMMKQRRRGR